MHLPGWELAWSEFGKADSEEIAKDRAFDLDCTMRELLSHLWSTGIYSSSLVLCRCRHRMGSESGGPLASGSGLPNVAATILFIPFRELRRDPGMRLECRLARKRRVLTGEMRHFLSFASSPEDQPGAQGGWLLLAVIGLS